MANSLSIINRPVLSFLRRNHGAQQTETRPAAWDLQPCGEVDQNAHTALTLVDLLGFINAACEELLKLGLTDTHGLFVGKNRNDLLITFQLLISSLLRVLAAWYQRPGPPHTRGDI